MKNITMFICSLASGGAEHQLVLLSNFLQERGYNVSIVTFGKAKDHYSFNSQIHRIRIKAGNNPLKRFLNIQNFFLKLKTDCVISFGARESSLCLPALFFRSNVKVLAGERCLYNGKIPTYKKINLNILYKRATNIVTNSYSQKNELISLKKTYEDKISVITNYTDVDLFRQTVLPHNAILKVGIFARYAPQKNCIRFAEAIKIVKQEYGSVFHVSWYGSISTNTSANTYYQEFVEKIKELDIDDVITTHDAIKDVSSKIAGFDLMCLPSLFEGFSNTLSEYISCGRPVLASNVADNGIMVLDGINGFLFDPLSIDDMVNAFRKFFVLSKEQKEQMAASSRKHAESLFNKDSFVNQYITLIEK